MDEPVKIGKFIGAAVRAQAFEGVSVAENTYPQGFVSASHSHDSVLLSLVLQGEATEEFRGRTRILTPQSILYTPAHETHGHVFRNPGRWLNIQFSNTWLARLSPNSTRLPESPQLIKNHTAVAWAARVRTELKERDAVSQIAIEGALLLLITDLARLPVGDERTPPRWLHTVEDAIEASVAAPPSIDELAALAGVHASHLLRVFRKYHQTTIANYVRVRRIERARAQIAAAKLPLSMIALDAGFSDQSHFTRVFRQAFGQTPGQYARSLLGA
ncbi:MAG: AraC family transcriptional regulator [Gemmatimonadaceae bacterium]